jgi:hypothetical protein
MLDWLKNFDLRHWWNVAIALGLAVVITAIAANDHIIALVGFGIVACGFGERMNHRVETEFVNNGAFASYERVNGTMGLVLDGLGVILLASGFFRFLSS